MVHQKLNNREQDYLEYTGIVNPCSGVECTQQHWG